MYGGPRGVVPNYLSIYLSCRGTVANMRECDIIESEFELQSNDNVQFRINTEIVEKGIISLILFHQLCVK